MFHPREGMQDRMRFETVRRNSSTTHYTHYTSHAVIQTSGKVPLFPKIREAYRGRGSGRGKQAKQHENIVISTQHSAFEVLLIINNMEK